MQMIKNLWRIRLKPKQKYFPELQFQVFKVSKVAMDGLLRKTHKLRPQYNK